MPFVLAFLCLGLVCLIVIAVEVEQEMYFFKKGLDKNSPEIKLQIKQKRSSLYKNKTKFFIGFMIALFFLALGAMAQMAFISSIK